MNFPFANAVVVRFGNTLRDSVYQQLLWAKSELGLDGYFRSRLSPMEITYIPTGQKIIFRGADDPLKLKGVKFPTGYAAIVWMEELGQPGAHGADAQGGHARPQDFVLGRDVFSS